jgi:hypothetical protein
MFHSPQLRRILVEFEDKFEDWMFVTASDIRDHYRTTLTSLTTTFISTTTTTTRSRASSAKRGPAAPRPSNFPR